MSSLIKAPFCGQTLCTRRVFKLVLHTSNYQTREFKVVFYQLVGQVGHRASNQKKFLLFLLFSVYSDFILQIIVTVLALGHFPFSFALSKKKKTLQVK